MVSKSLSFHRTFRTPSALSNLLKKMPELDIHDLGLDDESVIDSGRNERYSPSPSRKRSRTKPLRSISCGRAFRKPKAQVEQPAEIPKNGKDPKSRVKFSRSTSCQRHSTTYSSAFKGSKQNNLNSQEEPYRSAYRSEPVEQSRIFHLRDKTDSQENRCQLVSLDKSQYDLQADHGNTLAKRKKLVRFVEEPEIIPPISSFLDYESSEESIHGPSTVSINFFKILRRQ